MKHSIWCKLFGHIWQEKHTYWQADKVIGVNYLPVDNCVRCGLSKEEVFKS